MRKSILLGMLCLLSAAFTPQQIAAATPEPVTITDAVNNPEVPERVKTLLLRVEEIRAMDRSKLTRAERKELRKELRAINTELKSTGNGIYLSVGAIIIIILLLILIL
ncbi:MAG TPA: hypothetical protein VF676_10555 [Flavobacterium sp.]|jgi:hypothetical protein